MDFSVEATVHLNLFPDETKVRELLSSRGFALTHLSSSRVRVKGSFLELKAVKASLEPLLNSQAKTPSSSPPVLNASSGAISKRYINSSSDGTRGRSGSRSKPPQGSPTSPNTSSSNPTPLEYNASFSQRQDQRGSIRSSKVSFVIDKDVFEYAERLRKKDIDDILASHNVTLVAGQTGDNCNVAIQGRSAGIAAGKLRSLLNSLSESLRTQEVPLKDMDRLGKTLWERIQRNGNVHNSVLVCRKNDKLHLIGPSGEGYELKQRLLGRLVDQSGRTGRTLERSFTWRSSSLPAIRRRSTNRDNGCPAPAGAAGYSPSRYLDDKQEGAKARKGAAERFGALKRSFSESRCKTRAERANGPVPDTRNKHPAPKWLKRLFPPFPKLSKKDIKQKFSIRK